MKLVSLVEAGVAGQTPFGNSYGWGEHPWVGIFACEVEKPVSVVGSLFIASGARALRSRYRHNSLCHFGKDEICREIWAISLRSSFLVPGKENFLACKEWGFRLTPGISRRTVYLSNWLVLVDQTGRVLLPFLPICRNAKAYEPKNPVFRWIGKALGTAST